MYLYYHHHFDMPQKKCCKLLRKKRKTIPKMAVSLYFGLPGCGKTTIATSIVVKEAQKMEKGKSRYSSIYTNFGVNVNNPNVMNIKFSWLGKYDIHDALIIIDEATIEADSRDHATFAANTKRFFLLHRHYNCDIILFTQQWDGVDKKIRVITDRVYYIYKPPIIGHWYSKFYQIPYGIIIPEKKDDNEKLGEIVQGYCKPSLLKRIFAPKIFRPKYYQYFDSWERPDLPPLPTAQGSQPNTEQPTQTQT